MCLRRRGKHPGFMRLEEMRKDCRAESEIVLGEDELMREKVVDWRVPAVIGVDVALAVVGPWKVVQDDKPLQMCAAVIAIWTYFMVWSIQRHPRQTAAAPASNPVRDAVASAVIVTYLVMVSWTTFNRLATNEEQVKLDALSQVMVSHFTTLTAIVVIAYIGANSAEKLAPLFARPQQSFAGASADDAGTTRNPPPATPSPPL